MLEARAPHLDAQPSNHWETDVAQEAPGPPHLVTHSTKSHHVPPELSKIPLAAFSSNPFSKLYTRLVFPVILWFSYIPVASLSSEKKVYNAKQATGQQAPTPLETQDPLAFIYTPAT